MKTFALTISISLQCLPNQPQVCDLPPRQLFLLYAPDDADAARELHVHLSVVKARIKTFCPDDLRPGRHMAAELQDQLNLADLVAVLVSPCLYADPSCLRLLKQATDRLLKRGCLVVPVLLRPMGAWPKGCPLRDLKPLPEDGKPICGRPHRDDVWAEVVSSLDRLLPDAGVSAL